MVGESQSGCGSGFEKVMTLDQQRTEETLSDFLREVWSGRRFVAAGLLFGAVAAFCFCVLAVPHHQGRIVLAPANPMNIGAVVSSASAYSSNVQVSPAQTAADSFTRFEASYKGAAVASLLLRDPEITKGLAADKAFKFSKGPGDWTPAKLSEYIAQRVEIDPIGETALRSFHYLHPDRAFAALFLRRLHLVTDGLIRHGVRKDVNGRIDYLNAAIGETYNPEHRRALTDLLMEQERLKMMVSIDQPYAASVVVPSSVSSKMRWPDTALIVLLFTGVGGLLGFVVFSALNANVREDLIDVLDTEQVKQEDWFFPESGNNNEKPEAKKPLTGESGKKLKKKAQKKPESKVGKSSRKSSAATPEAAE